MGKKKTEKNPGDLTSFKDLEEYLKNNKVSKKELEKIVERIRYIEFQIQEMIYEGSPPRDGKEKK